MPLTPFHWSILFIGFLFFNTFSIPALLLSSIVMDIEPFYYLFISPNPSGELHGFFHTYIGATIIAFVIALVLIKWQRKVDYLFRLLRIDQKKFSNKEIYISSFIGAYSHILFDSFMHADVKPFWPITTTNPFLGIISVGDIYFITTMGLVFTTSAYIIHLIRTK